MTMSNPSDWPDAPGIPAKLLWRILPAELRKVVACKVIHAAASTLQNQVLIDKINDELGKSTKEIDLGRASVRFAFQPGHLSSADGDEDICGTDVATLLAWMISHGGHGPIPGPWVEITTMALMGQLAARAGLGEVSNVLRGAMARHAG